MKKVYILNGLDCPHCSSEIEKDIGKIKGVDSVSINLIKQAMTVELSKDYTGDFSKTVEKVVHKHEPDVEVVEKAENTKSSKHDHDGHEHCHGHHEHEGHEH